MSISFDGLGEFINRLDKSAKGDFKKELNKWLEATGFQFLEEIKNEIIRTQTVDTRRLLESFDKGNSDNMWSISNGNLTLEIGTNVTYASFVNDGHFTVDPARGKDRRWVPGKWNGSRFEYDKNADTGMLLTIKWIDGTGYWDNALAIFEKMFEASLDKMLQRWLDTLL